MPSFDAVSELDTHELTNAVDHRLDGWGRRESGRQTGTGKDGRKMAPSKAMDPARWQGIERLYHAAHERPVPERPRFWRRPARATPRCDMKSSCYWRKPRPRTDSSRPGPSPPRAALVGRAC